MGKTLAEHVASIRANLQIPEPQTGSADTSLADAVIEEQVTNFVQNELTQFFPKFVIRSVTATATGTVTDRVYTLDDDVREVVGIYPRSDYEGLFDSAVDSIFRPVIDSPLPGLYSEPSLWLTTMREISQLRRVSQKKFLYSWDDKKLYLQFEPVVGESIYYLPRLLRTVSDADMGALPGDLDALIEMGSRAKVLRVLGTISQKSPGFQGTGAFNDQTTGKSLSTEADRLDAIVDQMLYNLDIRTRNAVPLRRGI